MTEALIRVLPALGVFAVCCALWAWMPQKFRVALPDPAATRVVIAVAAVIAAVAPGPGLIGQDIADAVFRGALVALIAAAGAVAPTRVVGVALLAVAVASHSTTAGVAAAAVVAALVAGMLAGVELRPWARTAAAAAVGLAATRPVAGGGALAVLVPAAAIVAVLVAALVRLRPSLRRRVLVVTAGLGACCVAAAAASAVAALAARGDFQEGLRAARLADTAVRAGDVDGANHQLQAMDTRLSAGRDALRQWWDRPGWFVPVLGVNLRALDHLASAGLGLAHAGSTVVSAAQARQLHLSGGRVPVEALQALDTPLRMANDAVTTATAAAASSQSRWLVAPVASRLTTLLSRLSAAGRSTSIALQSERLAVSMLGTGGASRRYFLALTSPSELRGATALIANFGEVVCTDGAVHLERFSRIEDLIHQAPDQPDGLGFDPQFVAVYRRAITNRLWENLTVTPDFPTAAQAIEGLYPASGGVPVDGVISVDPAGLGALLALEGPITVPGWPTPIASGTIERILEHDEYVAYPDTKERSRFLGQVARQVIERFRTIDVKNVTTIVRALSKAVSGKHLLLASSRPDEEASIEAIGAGGAMAPVQGRDALSVMSSNGAGNKIDYFLRRTVVYDATVDARRRLRASLNIQLDNLAPAAGEPRYLTGSRQVPGLPPGTNRMTLSIFTPWQPVGATLDGSPIPLGRDSILGRNLLSVSIDIPPQSSRTVHVDLAGAVLQPYGLRITAQPTTVADQYTVRVHNAGGRSIDQTFPVRGDMVIGATSKSSSR